MTPYLKIGIIGAGNISDLHAKGYISHNDSKILAVADINKNNSTKMSKKWGAKYQYTDYKDLIKNEEIDVTTRVGTVKLMKLQEREYFNNNYDYDFLDQYSFRENWNV